MTVAINIELARKVSDLVGKGLVCGLGEPKPGKMCVEAAVCYAMGLPHSDNPPCVDEDVRAIKIAINDMGKFANNMDRGEAMKGLAIAQLGSNELPAGAFLNAFRANCTEMFINQLRRFETWTTATFDTAVPYSLELLESKYVRDLMKVQVHNRLLSQCYYCVNPTVYTGNKAETDRELLLEYAGMSRVLDALKSYWKDSDYANIAVTTLVTWTPVSKQAQRTMHLIDMAMDALKRVNAPGMKLWEEISGKEYQTLEKVAGKTTAFFSPFVAAKSYFGE